ncbi:Serine/threonine-protein kinase, partial [Dinochytrium kinnereticum]
MGTETRRPGVSHSPSSQMQQHHHGGGASHAVPVPGQDSMMGQGSSPLGGVVFGGSPGVVLFGGGGGGGGGSGSGSPSGTPPSPRMSSGRDTLGKGRVFGSLRDSTHNFLNAGNPIPTTTPTPTPLESPNQTPSPLNRHHEDPAFNPYPTILPPPKTDATQDPAHLLSTLNLCALRGHALNLLADERYREFLTRTTGITGGAILDHLGETAVHTREEASMHHPLVGVEGVAEEALGLFLAALGLYQMGIEAAKVVWGWVVGGGGRGVVVNVGSLSEAVQWIRERFNECLERAQDCRGFLGDGEDGGGGGEGGGRPVERVVYERALEIARTASHSEQTDPTLAESGYTQAVLLLEAILACHGSTGGSSSSLCQSTLMKDDPPVVTLSEQDRAVVE